MNEENSSWQYKPDGGDSPPPAGATDDPATLAAPSPSQKSVSWEASEFIEHHHGAVWYATLAAATGVLAALILLLTSRDKLAAAIIVILGMIVGVFAGQKPRVVRYEITESGLRINDKLYGYGNFKSFSVMREGMLSSVNLFPLKRFMPPVSAFFEPNDEQKITSALGNYLPYEERKMDNIDRLSRRLRL